MALVKNTTNGTLEFDIDGVPGRPPKHYSVAAGEVVDIADGYCQPYLSDTHRRQTPIIERVAPGMKVLPAKQQAKARAAAGALEGKTDDVGAVAAVMAKFDDVLAELKNLKATNRQLVERVAELEDARDADEDAKGNDLGEVVDPAASKPADAKLAPAPAPAAPATDDKKGKAGK